MDLDSDRIRGVAMRAPIVPTGMLWFGRTNEGKSRVNAKVCDRGEPGPVATLGSDAYQATDRQAEMP